MSYPIIILDESNKEIEDCTVLSALVHLFIRIRLRDGKSWDYAEVTDYSEGMLWFTVNVDDEESTYQLMAPVTSIESITYI